MKRIACLLVTLMLGAVCFGQTANKATASNPGFPRVVARLNLLNGTNKVGPAILYTPTNSGVFRASIVMTITVGSGGDGFWDLAVSYVPQVGLNESLALSLSASSPISGGSESPFSAAKDSPITVSVTGGPGALGSHYNAYIILEQLE